MRSEPQNIKLPPQNIEAEQAVLGAILLQGEPILKAIEILKEQDFYRGVHQKIYRAMLALFEASEAIDIVTVSEQLKRVGDYDAVGGLEYLKTLADSTPSAANVAYHSEIVKERSILRGLLNATTEIAEQIYSSSGLRADDILDESEKKIFEIAQNRIRSSFTPINIATKDAIKMIEGLYERKEAITGIPSGFKDLDEYTAGFQKGDLIILGGRPSAGKTAFGLNIAQHVALELKEPVAIFSLEMSTRQLIIRMLCSDSMVDASSVRRGYIKNNFHKLTRSAGRLHEAPVWIDDTSGISALEMRAKARRLKREQKGRGLSLILVDYLQLMKGSGNYEQRVQEISEISRSLKSLAKELDLPVLALSQLNRSVERERRKPNMSDLRESGAIEQDADVILFLYKDDKEKEKDKERAGFPGEEGIRRAEVVHLDIAKQRNGPTGSLKLTFLPQYTKFTDHSPEDYVYREEEAF